MTVGCKRSCGTRRRSSLPHFLLGLLLTLFVLGKPAHATDAARPRFKAVAFDYFVIFDPNSVVSEVEDVFPGKGLEFTKAWRSKQFEYSFLRAIADDHEDFFKVTGEALDFTAEQMHLQLTPESRARLLGAYLTLKPWPDAVAGLNRLKAAGVKIVIVSNFSSTMLRANADHARISSLFDDLVSTEVNRTFKPDPRAYELGMKRLHLQKSEIVFAAFGGWDAYGAKRFGYTTVWINRFDLPAEKLGVFPDRVFTRMDDLVDFALGPPEHGSNSPSRFSAVGSE